MLLETIKDTFDANPVRIPEERLQPLTLLGKISNKAYFLGNMYNIENETLLEDKPNINKSKLANVSSKKSKKVNLDIGINILDGFLKGFGINANLFGEIKNHFANVKSLSFSFDDVNRFYIEPIELFSWLQNKDIIIKSPVLQPFMQEENSLYVIDSIITSKSFSISIENKLDNNVETTIPSLQKILATTDVKVETTSASQTGITFKGNKNLTFAFSCFNISWDKSGKINTLMPNTELVNLGLGNNKDFYYPVEKAILYDEMFLIEWTNQTETL
ncbi:gasdermin [Spirosoma horti]